MPEKENRQYTDQNRATSGRRSAKVTHLDHLRPNLCWAVSHNDSSLLEGSDLVGSSTYARDGVNLVWRTSANLYDKKSPFPPDIMAPAWPIRRPGGAVRPATKPTTGFGFARVRLYFSRYSAASSSMVPPISPIITIPALIESRKVFVLVSCESLTVGVVVLEEDLDNVDVLRSGERIATNPNAKRLSETSVSSLCDRLIGQRPGT